MPLRRASSLRKTVSTKRSLVTAIVAKDAADERIRASVSAAAPERTGFTGVQSMGFGFAGYGSGSTGGWTGSGSERSRAGSAFGKAATRSRACSPSAELFSNFSL